MVTVLRRQRQDSQGKLASMCTHTCTCTCKHVYACTHTPYIMFRSWNLCALLVDYKIMQPLENGRLSMVVHAYNSSTQNADAGKSSNSILSQENKSNTKCNTADYLYVSVDGSTFIIARKETQSSACQWRVDKQSVMFATGNDLYFKRRGVQYMLTTWINLKKLCYMKNAVSLHISKVSRLIKYTETK